MIIINNKYFKQIITEEQIRIKIKSISNQINSDYSFISSLLSPAQSDPLFLVGILNGSFMILTDLCKQLKIPIIIDFIKVKSYVLQKSEKITQLIGLKIDLNNKHLLVVQDIVDTGQSIAYLKEMVKKYQLKSFKIFSLFTKPQCLEVQLKIDYVGFQLSKNFVIGYGLDYNEYARNLTSLYQKVQKQ